MSDETFGKAAREHWDQLERAHIDSKIQEAVDGISSALVVIEDYLSDDATPKQASAALDRINEHLGTLGYFI